MDRNAPCPCGSKKKYKKCCLPASQKGVEPIKQDPFFIIPIVPEIEEECDYAAERLTAGDLRRAEEIVNRLSFEYPNSHRVLFLQGVCAIQRSSFSEAIACFEQAVKVFPYLSEGYYNLVGLYRHNYEIRKAVSCLKKVIEIEGAKGELARLATQGLKDLEEIVCDQPGLTLEQFLRQEEIFEEASDCFCSKKFEQAIDLFKEVLAKIPDHVQSYGNLGIAYASLGRKKDAIECLEKALALDPTYEPARSNLETIQLLEEGEKFDSTILQVDYYREQLALRGFCKTGARDLLVAARI